MSIETRPALDGLSDDQRLLALAHWYLFRLTTEQPQALAYCWPASVTPDVLLRQMEGGMQPETKHRLAMARDRYWKEVNG
jgi:hypothetical protein